MAVTVTSRLCDTQHAFDSVAAEYHRSNAENSILRQMRRRTLDAIAARVPAGARILDLGCGPGSDAVTLAADGYRVTAIDSSPGMVAEARRRIRATDLEALVDVRHLAIEDADDLPAEGFDAVYSNFGPLNCVADLQQAAHAVARRLRPDGILVATVIGRVCPWELALYLGRGDRERAGIRFARALVPVPLNGRTVWTRYCTPREFRRTFKAAGFKTIRLRALGLFVPPPYMNAFSDRHPLLTAVLRRAEDVLGGWPALRSIGDHFLIVMRKESPASNDQSRG